jgi:FPC/CPF motif-containing protein YcgG
MNSTYSIASKPHAQSAIDAVSAFVSQPDFPCVGARSALNKQRMRFGQYGALGDPRDAAELCADLRRFSEEFPEPGRDPVSYVAMFAPTLGNETQFATNLWAALQALHDIDRQSSSWDPTVGDDPEQQDFSFSIGGRAFFVVGLHPGASRMARRAPFPCLVFNFHDQFELLRAGGQYAGLQKVIRRRDIELQGSLNPMLASFGDQSEARQYSGVALAESWKCPFHP